jgi:hypothetical protein
VWLDGQGAADGQVNAWQVAAKAGHPAATAVDEPLGEEASLRLREVAIAFDARLRAGLADSDLDRLDDLLAALAANVQPNPGRGGP